MWCSRPWSDPGGRLLILVALALAEPPTAPPPDDGLQWGGVVVPLLGANTQDGFGLGVGGEVFARPPTMDQGYRAKLTASLWVTTNLTYTNDFVQLDLRGETDWLGRAGFRGWTNHAFAGIGGDRIQRPQDATELGNVVYGPYAFLGLSRPVSDIVRWFAVASYRTTLVRADPDGLLAALRPDGVDGGTYTEGTLGIELDTTDRWPMPHTGVRAETSLRAGLSLLRDGGTDPTVGAHGEVIAWHALGRHLVVGSRVVVDQTLGRRPFFLADTLGGRWRDELGSEQAFAGYGRTRTRGDGVLASMLELRPYFGRTRHPVLDFEFHASLFAEQGWLFRGWDAGPSLPTVGFGPQVLFQGAIQCRPFVAWGWRGEPGSRRRPVPQFGVSFLDPL